MAALGFAARSDTFRVRALKIDGASTNVQHNVEDALVPGCSETSETTVVCPPNRLGPNELTLSTRELEQQLASMPAIAQAHVTARLPGTLQIALVERQPEVAWVVGPDVYRVAADGMVIDQGSPAGLKIVIGQVAGDAVKPGDRIDVSVIEGAKLLQERLPMDAGLNPQRIQYSAADGLAVIGDQNLIAMFGAPQDLNLKMAELQRILDLARGQKSPLAFVDLRYKTPYFRPN
ncbi:MAG TPA: FtsQ-type POTRA domain-containing protein [Chloroflexota bacterium]|nr:FtsQ-type POTRA domain-containing protein [Chloroflexota bacterium]